MFSYLAFNYQQSCQFIKNLLFFKLYYFSINPVTGYIEPFKESPLEKMTDEQKEYEAMKLVKGQAKNKTVVDSESDDN